jgi:hypothetical protein
VADPLKRLGAGGTAEIKDHPYFASIDWLKLQNLTLPPPFIPEVVSLRNLTTTLKIYLLTQPPFIPVMDVHTHMRT